MSFTYKNVMRIIIPCSLLTVTSCPVCPCECCSQTVVSIRTIIYHGYKPATFVTQSLWNFSQLSQFQMFPNGFLCSAKQTTVLSECSVVTHPQVCFWFIQLCFAKSKLLDGLRSLLQHFRFSVCYGSLHAFRMDVDGVTSKEHLWRFFSASKLSPVVWLKGYVQGARSPNPYNLWQASLCFHLNTCLYKGKLK